MLSFRKIGLHKRPFVFVNTEGYFDPFLAQIDAAVAADLGLDKVLVYRLDAARGTLTPNDPPAQAGTPPAGDDVSRSAR